MGIWSLHLRFKGDSTDYSTGILENATIKECVGAKGRHAMQSCSVSILDRILAAKIFNSKDDIEAKIYNGNTIVFEGVIRPFASFSAEMAHENPVDLEIIDYTQLLHCYVYTDLSEIEDVTQAVKDKCIQTFTCSEISISDLIRKLFTLTKITDKVNLTIPDMPNKKSYFVLEAGKYIDDVISELLYEYCLDYRFSPGSLTVFSTKVVDIDSNPIQFDSEISDFNLVFDVSKEDMVEDGVSISYGDYHEGKYKIWSEDNRWDLNWWNGLWTIWEADFESGYYYNNDMHKSLGDYKDKVLWQFPEAIKDKIIISVSNIEVNGELHDETGVEYSSYCDEYDKDGGKPYIKYSGLFDYTWGGKGWGFSMDVWASVFYRDSSLRYKKILGLNPTKLTADYIEKEDEAKLLCANLQARNEKSVFSYKFSTKREFVPGSIVRINEDKVTGLVADIRIVSKVYNPLTRLYRYEAEGAGEVRIPEIFSSASGGSPTTEYPQLFFFQLISSKNSFLVEEADSDFTVTASGTIFSQYGCTPQWSFNGTVQGESGYILTLRKSLLKVGINTVKCSAVLNGQVHERTITITLIQAALDMSNQYEWTVTKDMNPPKAREVFFSFDDYLLSFDEHYIVLDDTWTQNQPDVAPDEFLWLRLPTKDGDYVVIRMTGNPYQDFSIYSDPTTYINSKRLTEDRTVTICVSYGNIKDPVISYQLVGNPEGVMQVSENGMGTNVFKILAGQTPKEFTVQVILVGIGAKTLTIHGTDVPENDSMYLGRTTVMPPAREDILFVDGDWVLYMGEDTESYKKGHVYKKNGDIWAETTDTKELADVYWDTDDLRTQNIYARVLFAQSILAENVSVLGEFRFQKDVGENRCLLTISQNGFDATYGPKINERNPGIFSFDFDSGRVFIGKPNIDKSAPESGFMYDPLDNSIHTLTDNTIISSDGLIITKNIKAVNADISGNSYFRGNFNCKTIRTAQMEETKIKVNTSSDIYQAKNIHAFVSNYVSYDYSYLNNYRIKARLESFSKVMYIYFTHYEEGSISSGFGYYRVNFQDGAYNNIPLDSLGLSVDGQSTEYVETSFYRGWGSNYTYSGTYLRNIELSLPEGGDILILDIKRNPSDAELSKMEIGEIYASNGSLRIK